MGGYISRICVIKPPCREAIIYTDASTPKWIVAFLAVDVAEFRQGREFRNIWAEVPNPQRQETFISTTYIYGLEMLAILATVSPMRNFLGGALSFISATLIVAIP